jgi:hypothetical protein
MKPTRQQLTLCALAAMLALAHGSASAGSTDLGNGTVLDYGLTASYGLGVRAARPADALINGPINPLTGLPTTVNMDDGNRNFKRGSAVNNRFSLLGELDLHRGAFGGVLRASAFYDGAYHGANDNDSPGTINKSGDPNAFTSEVQRLHGRRARLLDAYVYGSVDPTPTTNLNVRVGRQVVAWGESLFFSGIAAAQGIVDATKANVAGVELKDILLPSEQVSAQLRIGKDLSLLGYYQLKYRPNEIDGAGSYFSYADVVGPGAEFIRAAPGFDIPRGADIVPGNRGQWGLGLRWRARSDLELGLYHLRYHDKNPNVVTDFATLPVAPFIMPTAYHQKYFDNIKATALSVSTSLGEANVAGELSFKQDVPVLVDTLLGPSAARARATQLLLSGIRTFGPSPLADQVALVGELGFLRVGRISPFVDAFGMANDQLASSLGVTRSSSALQLRAELKYNNVFSGWDLTVPIGVAAQLKGKAAVAGAFGGLVGKGDTRLSVGANFKYLNNLEFGVAYNAFLGSADPVNRPLADRDFVALSAKYSF